MSGPESSNGLSLWPKLLLWGAVILVGILYLGSVNKHESADREREAVRTKEVAPAEPELDAPAPAETGEGTAESAVSSGHAPWSPSAPSAGEPAVAERAAPDTGSHSEQSQAAPESVGEPGPDARQSPEKASEAEVEKAAAVIPQKPNAGPEEKAETEAPGEVTPAEAKAFSEAVMSQGDAAQTAPDPLSGAVTPAPTGETPREPVQEASDPATPSAIAPAVPGQPAVTAAPPAQPPTVSKPPQSAVVETIEERRARIMAEYESMRKRAEEEMRRRWEQRGMPAPYGYPGYAPGYYPQPQR